VRPRGRGARTALRGAARGGGAVALHLRARACPPEEAIAVGAELGLQDAVGTLWLEGGALEDPLLRLELEERPRVRMAEERGPLALYEAVVTTLAERRA